MTNAQREQLREIIDLNWELTQESDPSKAWEMAKELGRKKHALREDMGHDEYDLFMENGRKMFAPKDS